MLHSTGFKLMYGGTRLDEWLRWYSCLRRIGSDLQCFCIAGFQVYTLHALLTMKGLSRIVSDNFFRAAILIFTSFLIFSCWSIPFSPAVYTLMQLLLASSAFLIMQFSAVWSSCPVSFFILGCWCFYPHENWVCAMPICDRTLALPFLRHCLLDSFKLCCGASACFTWIKWQNQCHYFHNETHLAAMWSWLS